MKIGFVSRIGEFPEKEWKDEFEIAGEKGVSHLELIVNYPFFGPQTYTSSQINKLKKLATENNLELILHLLPNQYQLPKGIRYSDSPKKFQEHEKDLKNKVFNIASLDERVRKFSIEEIKRTIHIAKKLQAPLIVIHGGSFTENNSEESLKRARKSLEELNSYSNKVKLAVENLPTLGHFGNPPNELPVYTKDLIYLVKDLENIGICFDLGHANTLGDPIEFYEEIKRAGKIWDMHLHDNGGKRDDHLAIGKGNINFRKFMKKLKEDNYKGYFSIELDTWNETPEPMETKERLMALKYLKRLN
ncbi:sugar phosphate isomerase/epimerase [Candidatus Pacearchaeota archaeon]|nr:sugar phosphate isomerase/epimerase [Candidatus Pacearchaeota archaeon]